MRSFRLNKLIRDGVFDEMLQRGQRPEYRRLNDNEILHALKQKILEEGKEFDHTSDKAFEELADLLEVIEHMAEELGGDFKKLRQVQLKKRKRAGGFKKRAYVGMLHLEDDDPWVGYYAKDPERFPES